MESTSSTVTISIIGSAGRKNDANIVSLDLYNKLLSKAEQIITEEFKLNWQDITLVSGGAAFCDHLAVSLFNKYHDNIQKLILYLPCKYDRSKERYHDNGQSQWFNNPGRTSNYYHDNFIRKTGINSLKELGNLINNDKVIFNEPDDKSKGFHARNSLVAKSNYMIAFTGGSDSLDNLTIGGTSDTWKKCKTNKENKVHITFKDL